jgi:hypothetical protein
MNIIVRIRIEIRIEISIGIRIGTQQNGNALVQLQNFFVVLKQLQIAHANDFNDYFVQQM